VELLNFIGMINAVIFTVLMSWRMFSGHGGSQSAIKASLSIFVLFVGFKVAAMLPAPDTFSAGFKMCSVTIEEQLWSCGGWPVFNSSIVSLLDGMSSTISHAMQIPAGVATFLACLHIHSRLLRGLTFEASDIAKAFAGGFIIYASLAFLPTLTGWFNEALKLLSIFGSEQDASSSRIENLCASLSKMRELADLDVSTINNIGAFLFRMFASLPLLIVGITNFVIIILQYFLIAFIPVSVFLVTLKRDSDPSHALSLLGTYLFINIFQGVEWFFLGTVSIAAPSATDDMSMANSWSVIANNGAQIVIMTVLSITILTLAILVIILPLSKRLISAGSAP